MPESPHGATPAVDLINHPPYYSAFTNDTEVVDIAECLNFNRGNAIKYLARAGAKDPGRELEDLKKAAWYVTREIERMQGREYER